jgi:hypothetical protein
LVQRAGLANSPDDAKPTGHGVGNSGPVTHDEVLLDGSLTEFAEGGVGAVDLDTLDLGEGPELTPTLDDDQLVGDPAATGQNSRKRQAPPPPPPPPPPKNA